MLHNEPSKNSTSLIPLSALKPGQGGVVDSVQAPADVRLKLLELGIGEGEYIRHIRKSPFGDPLEFELMNYRLAIRKSEADKIFVKPA